MDKLHDLHSTFQSTPINVDATAAVPTAGATAAIRISDVVEVAVEGQPGTSTIKTITEKNRLRNIFVYFALDNETPKVLTSRGSVFDILARQATRRVVYERV